MLRMNSDFIDYPFPTYLNHIQINIFYDYLGFKNKYTISIKIDLTYH